MPKEKPAALSSSLLACKGGASVSADSEAEKVTSVQVKFDAPMYKRLKLYGVHSVKSNQEILYEAVKEYLQRNGG